jgi:exodeoxyribonuclease VII small subunit
MSKPGEDEALGYAAALAELDDILAELEAEELDVDVLAARVARAAVLVRLCRGRIQAARVEVERIVADLEALADDEADDQAIDDEPGS